jgi:hypothetical protein
MRLLARVCIVCVLVLSLAFVCKDAHTRAPIRCPEDTIIVGQGDFHNGRWTRYVCATTDDFVHAYLHEHTQGFGE